MLSRDVVKALANERRLEILHWLKAPRSHFPRQVDGDLVRDGVCGVLIAQKLGISQPTASEHLKVLSRAGLVRGKRIKQWTFYRRDERRVAGGEREPRSPLRGSDGPIGARRPRPWPPRGPVPDAPAPGE